MWTWVRLSTRSPVVHLVAQNPSSALSAHALHERAGDLHRAALTALRADVLADVRGQATERCRILAVMRC